MRTALWVLLAASAAGQSRVSITGTFKNPDNTAVTGTLLVQPGRVSASNTCGGGSLTLANAAIPITNGLLGPLSLYPSTCLGPVNGGAVTSVSITKPGSGYAGTCIAKFAGAAMVMPATATCTFSSGTLSGVTMQTHGVYKTTTAPKLTISCDPACSGQTDAATVVTFTQGQLYTATVALKDGTVLYSTSWSVPNVGSIDVTQLQ